MTCKPPNICNENDSFTKNSKTVDLDSSSNENKIEMESFLLAKKIKIQQCVDSNIFTTKSIAENLDLLIAKKFFFANNFAFTAVEHHMFKDLVTALHPGYTPANRKALARELLDKVSD